MQVPKAIQPLRDNVFEALECYFKQMNGHEVTDLYEMVLTEIEKPLFQSVLAQTNGNQSKAAEMLGLNRSTLRKKLKQYKLL
jgi:Fis family transcriptional regulator